MTNYIKLIFFAINHFELCSKWLINSRTAIAGTVIGLLLVFLQFKEFELYCGAVFLNSRTAIAGAIIGLLLVLYNSKNLNCIGTLSFFYDSKRSIGEVLFFNQFYWSDF